MSLVDALAGPEGDLLALQRLQSATLPSPGLDPERRDFAIPASALIRSTAASRSFAELGFRAAVMLSDARFADRDSPLHPLPIIPNLQGFMREAVEHGMVGAGLRRIRRVGPAALAGLGIRGLGRLAPLWRRDFPTMLQCFVELELADWRRRTPPVVFLHGQMTDLALAMDNPRILEAFLATVPRRAGALPGLVTANLGTLAQALVRWGLQPAAVIAPWNPGVAHMRPNPDACRSAIPALPGIPVWGIRDERLRGPSPVERAAASSAGLAGFLRDDLDLWSPILASSPVKAAA